MSQTTNSNNTGIEVPNMDRDSLTERDIKLVECLKIQSKIRDLEATVEDTNLYPTEISKEKLNRFGLLIARLKDRCENLGLEELEADCQDALECIAKVESNFKDIQSNRPIEKIGHKEFNHAVYGTEGAIRTVGKPDKVGMEF